MENSDIRMFSMIQERTGSILIKLRLDTIQNGGDIQSDSDNLVKSGGTSPVFLSTKSTKRRIRDQARSEAYKSCISREDSDTNLDSIASRTRSKIEVFREESAQELNTEVASPMSVNESIASCIELPSDSHQLYGSPEPLMRKSSSGSLDASIEPAVPKHNGSLHVYSDHENSPKPETESEDTELSSDTECVSSNDTECVSSKDSIVQEDSRNLYSCDYDWHARVNEQGEVDSRALWQLLCVSMNDLMKDPKT